jgi:hypothetical protein
MILHPPPPWPRRHLTPELRARISAAHPLKARLHLDGYSADGPWTAWVSWAPEGVSTEVARARHTSLEAAVERVLASGVETP